MDWLTCPCGNTPDGDGFDPCLTDGTPVEPLADGPWDGTSYACGRCGEIHQYDPEVTA